MYEHLYMYVHLFLYYSYVCKYIGVYVCTCVCLSACVDAWMHGCMHACVACLEYCTIPVVALVNPLVFLKINVQCTMSFVRSAIIFIISLVVDVAIVPFLMYAHLKVCRPNLCCDSIY